MNLREEAEQIVRESIAGVLPDRAVIRALEGKKFAKGKLYLAAVGKAAWQMAAAAVPLLGDRLEAGIVVTKYGHVQGDLPRVRCFEGGHPVPDENSFRGTRAILEMVDGLREDDTVIFLLSGGGSSLFELPLIAPEELREITEQLLACGANIVEINTIRKRLSAVKGGKFAKLCEPARMFCVTLSDIVGDSPDMIASGPACPDTSTCRDAVRIAEKYQLRLSKQARACLLQETPDEIPNVETVVTGSVRELCLAAKSACEKLGYESHILTDQLTCEAREAGAFLAAIARTNQDTAKSLAFLAGGETIVHLTGSGKGGRNQELALGAAEGIAGLPGTAVFSVGSDGTDGPTDAAGGYCDSSTCGKLKDLGIDMNRILRENNSYEALKACGGLILTGPTGTNVNDVAVLLIRRGGISGA